MYITNPLYLKVAHSENEKLQHFSRNLSTLNIVTVLHNFFSILEAEIPPEQLGTFRGILANLNIPSC